jgi:putative permease
MKRVAINTALVLATFTIAMIVWQLHEAVVLFLFSLAIAAAMRPVIDELVAYRWPRSLALVTTYLLGVMLMGTLVYLTAVPLAHEVREALAGFVRGYDRVTTPWAQGSSLEQVLYNRLPRANVLADVVMGRSGYALAQTLLGVTWNVFETVVQFVIVIVLSIYWSLDQIHFERIWLSLLPANKRAETREIWRSVETGVGKYLRSEAIQALLAGLLLSLGYHVLGISYPTLLATGGALAWMIPWVGVLLAVIPALIVGLQGGVAIGIAAASYAVAVILLLEFAVEPRFFNRRRYNSLLVAMVALALGDSFGLVGLLIGPPLAVALQLGLSRMLREAVAEQPKLVVSIGAVARRLDALREMLVSKSPEQSPEVASMVDRLTKLVEDAHDWISEAERDRSTGQMLTDQGEASATRGGNRMGGISI